MASEHADAPMGAQSSQRSRGLSMPVGIIVSAAIVAVALGTGLWSVGQGFAARNVDQITVTGSSRADARSDRAVWTISANAQADSISDAVTQTNFSLESVRDYLVAGGIAAEEVSFDALSTGVNYEWIDGNYTSNVSSYSAYRSITVRTNDVDLVEDLSAGLGDILDQGVIVSANPPQYYVTTLPALRPELLRAAVEDAQSRAGAMLDVTGGAVGPAQAIRSGPFQVSSPDSVDVSDAGLYDTSTIDKTVTATVTVTFGTR